MWRLGFFFYEIAFGLLSVFIPLYVVTPAIGGSVVNLGIMTSAALLHVHHPLRDNGYSPRGA